VIFIRFIPYSGSGPGTGRCIRRAARGCARRRSRSAAQHHEAVAAGQDGGVLVDAQAELVRVQRHRAEQPVEPPALGEVHVDQDARQQFEARRGAYGRGGHPRLVAADDHRPGHHRRARAGAADHQRAVGHPGLQQGVERGAAQHRGDPPLVPAGEEHAGGGPEIGGGGLGPGAHPQRPDRAGAQAGERRHVLGLQDRRILTGGGDDHDVGGRPTGQRDEPGEDGRTPAFRPADDEQPRVIHRAPPQPTGMVSSEVKRNKYETSG
jgi:hypothetical protein